MVLLLSYNLMLLNNQSHNFSTKHGKFSYLSRDIFSCRQSGSLEAREANL